MTATLADFSGLGGRLERPLAWVGDYEEFQPFDQRFVDDWNRYVGIKPADLLARLEAGLPAGHGLTLQIDVTGSGNVSIDGRVTRQGREIGQFIRGFHGVRGGRAWHNQFRMNADAQGQGIGRRLSANFMGLYRDLGLQRVELTASWEMGGYAWARMGFVPDDWPALALQLRDRWSKLQAKAPADVVPVVDKILRGTDPKAIWLLADLATELPGKGKLAKALLTGIDWNGRILLTDAEQMRRFDAATAAAVPAAPGPAQRQPARPPARRP